MATIGLFGSSPYELQQGRQAQLATAADAYGKTNPNDPYGFDRARSGLYMAGSQLGGGVASLMGVEDPEMKKASDLQAILQQFDMTTPDGLMQAGKAAQAKGYGNEAMQAFAKAREMQAAALEAQVKQSTIIKNISDKATPEMKNAAAIAASQGAAQDSPEWANIYKTELARLTAGTTGASIKEVGVAESTRQPVYFDTTTKTQFVMGVDPTTGKQVQIPFNGGVDKTTSKVNVSSVNKGADAGAIEIAKLDAKRLEGAQTASDKAIEAAGALQQLATTQQGVIGAGAPARVAALRIFSTIGLASPKDNAALGNADTFNALAGERVLGFIKTLGTNPTDTDREFARSIGPALEKGTKTNQDLVAYLLKRSRETVEAAKAMETHFYGNNYSLKGYVSPFASNLKTTNPLQGLSDAELAAKIEAARQPK